MKKKDRVKSERPDELRPTTIYLKQSTLERLRVYSKTSMIPTAAFIRKSVERALDEAEAKERQSVTGELRAASGHDTASKETLGRLLEQPMLSVSENDTISVGALAKLLAQLTKKGK
jgi:hypothetical protein